MNYDMIVEFLHDTLYALSDDLIRVLIHMLRKFVANCGVSGIDVFPGRLFDKLTLDDPLLVNFVGVEEGLLAF